MMKKYILMLLAICAIQLTVIAQDCKNFVYMTNGKVVKYSTNNAKGKLTAQMVYRVKARSGNKTTVNSQVFDEKGKEISAADAEIICDGNNLRIDMRNFIPSGNAAQFKDMTAKAEVSFLSYPIKMQAGQQLPEGDFHMELFKDAQKMTDIAFKIMNRRVEGKESIITPAGTYDCFKISYNAELKTATFGISIPFNMRITEWYAAQLGLYIKSEATNKNGKLLSTTIVDSIN